MKKYKLPYKKEFIQKIDEKYWTPFLIFDEKSMLKNLKKFYDAFSWLPDFKNYYAVKAHPNPYILEILKKHGCFMDCSSLWELILAESIWLKKENIMFTSNNTPIKDFKKARDLWAIINFDDISHIYFYEKNIWKLPKIACCRYNPGHYKTWWNDIIWEPLEAKYWISKDQIFDAYQLLKDRWVKRFGLHTMVISNDLNKDSLVETADLILNLLVEIEKKLSIEFEFVNLWWGIWIPYEPKDDFVDIKYVSREIKKVYKKLIDNSSRKKPLNIVMEQWRYITWHYAQLVSKVRHIKNIYRDYVWLDSSMSDFMRPAIYWAYHHITVLWKEKEIEQNLYDVTWSLCENNDKFAINRKLPNISVWDYVVLHDCWAHWNAMWFNYNAKLKCKELLIKKDGNINLIKRAETLTDYFSTIDYPKLTKLLRN